MKNLLTLALLLIVTCILLSSCSSISKKSQNLATLYVGMNAESNNISVKLEGEDFQSKGISPIQTEKAMVKEIKSDENLLASTEPAINNGNVSSIIKEHKNSLAKLNSFDNININRNTNEAFSQYSNTPVTYQPVNFYNGGGRSSGGVPLWFLIVLCIFIPPLAVAIMYGVGDKFWISLILTLFFWIPGVIYALIQVLR